MTGIARRRPSLGPSLAPLRGILFVVTGCALYTVNDAVIKWMMMTYPVGELLALRGLFAMPPVLYLAWRAGGLRVLRVRSWRWQGLRIVFVLGSTFLFTIGLADVPLADAVAIGFTAPLFITALAPYALGEQVGWRRWSAVAVGFAGTLIIIRPTGDAFAWASLLILGAALCGALRDVLTRYMSTTESSHATMFVAVSAITLAGLCTAPFGWRMPTSEHFALLAVAGLMSGISQFLVIEAFRLAEAALLAPFKYSSLIWGVVMGYLVFGHMPDQWVALGATVVVASGLYILHRETVRRRQAAAV